MKRITSMLTGTLFAVLFAGGAFTSTLKAQNEPGTIFTIPFAFTIEGHSVAAGTYEMKLVSNRYLLSIRNLKTGEEEFFNVLPQQQRAIATQGMLVLHGCGQREDLTEFHVAGTSNYSATISSRHSKSSELESCSADDTTTIAAR